MTLDKKNDEWFKNHKDTLQGNIIRPHGRNYSRLLFFRFREEKKGEVIPALSNKVKQWITFAGNQKDQSIAWQAGNSREKHIGESLFVGFYLTHLGFQYLGKPFPGEFDHLSDHGIHCMLLLAHNKKGRLDNLEKFYKEQFTNESLGAEWKGSESGGIVDENSRWKPQTKIRPYNIDHFGFADGISDPVFLETKQHTAYNQLSDIQNYVFKEPETDAYGSFLIYMKLELDTVKFETCERRLKEGLKAKYPDQADLAAAYIIGRKRDGTPLSDETKDSKENWNDFKYGPTDTEKCPYYAHIRKMNDRSHGRAEKDITILRRGFSYKENGQASNGQDGPSVGLHFLSFQKSIETFDQQLAKALDTPGSPGADPLIGYLEGNNSRRKGPQQQENQRSENPRFNYEFPTIKSKGSAAFSVEADAGFVNIRVRLDMFAPSLEFFESLD